MKIKTFVEKAIKGGWSNYVKLDNQTDEQFIEQILSFGVVRNIFLDPKAWQAVCGDGTVEVSYGNWDDMKTMTSEFVPIGKYHMQKMIDFIWGGGTPEGYIKTL